MNTMPIRFTEVSLDWNYLKLGGWSLKINGVLHSISYLNYLLFLFHLFLQHLRFGLVPFLRVI